MTLRIATWNINSIRIRFPILRKMVQAENPDILCLQETKVVNELFPYEEAKQLGFDYIYADGQKSYNGVAILSKIPLRDMHTMDVLDNGERRHIGAVLPDGTEIHNFYVPAGGDIPDPTQNPKFKDKLAFLDIMTGWAQEAFDKNDKVIMVGDMNIAPLEHDVWSHKQLLKVVSHTPVEVERMQTLQDSLGWVDAPREHVSADEKLYSWWSYRNRDWQKSNRGRRLDHIWITPALKPHLTATKIIPDARSWEQPSDHVPVFADFNGLELA